jgi:hypothetical protein
MDKIIEYTDTQLYFLLYFLGFITIAIFDYSAITDNIIGFVFISLVIAPIIGAIVLIGLAILRGIVGIFSDLFHLISKAQKIA